MISLVGSCGPGMLVGLTCWPTSSSSDIFIVSLDLITFDGGEICSSIAVFWILDFSYCSHIPFEWAYRCLCLYQTLLEIIIALVCISWTDGVTWLNWSWQDWRKKLRRCINNGSLSVNATPHISSFSLKVFTKGVNSTTVLAIQIFVTMIYIFWFLTPIII